MAHVILDGYVVKQLTEKAIGIDKAKHPIGSTKPWTPLVWLPRSAGTDGDAIDIGDTDIEVRESIAEEKGLDY